MSDASQVKAYKAIEEKIRSVNQQGSSEKTVVVRDLPRSEPAEKPVGDIGGFLRNL